MRSNDNPVRRCHCPHSTGEKTEAEEGDVARAQAVGRGAKIWRTQVPDSQVNIFSLKTPFVAQ